MWRLSTLTLLALVLAVPLHAAEECSWDTPFPKRPGDGIRDIDFGGGVIVAVGGNDEGVIVRSTDGVVWIPVDHAVHGPLSSVTWTGSRFVAVGSSVLESEDGLVWRSISNGPALLPLVDVAGLGDRFIVIGSEASCAEWDGEWIECSLPPTAETIVNGEDAFVVVGGGGAWFSEDAGVWTQVSTEEWLGDATGSGGNGQWDVSWDGERFWVLCPAGLASSGDGLNWTLKEIEFPGWFSRALPTNGDGTWILAFSEQQDDWDDLGVFRSGRRLGSGSWSFEEDTIQAWHGSAVSFDGVEVAAGRRMSVRIGSVWHQTDYESPIRGLFRFDGTGSEWLGAWERHSKFPQPTYTAVSRDLVTWDHAEYPRCSFRPWIGRLGATWFGQGTEGPSFSSDGLSWQSNTVDDWPGGCFGSGVVASDEALVVFEADRVLAMDDEVSVVSSDLSGEWRHGVYTGDRFVIAADGGGIASSADGQSWSTVQLPTEYGVLDLEAGAGSVVGLFGNRSAGFVEAFRSDDHGLNWQRIPELEPAGSSGPTSLEWVAGRFMASGPSGVIQSFDGVHWSPAMDRSMGTLLWSGSFHGETILVAGDGLMWFGSCADEATSPSAGDRVVVPVAAAVAGVAGSSWSSEMEIVNPTSDWHRLIVATEGGARSEQVFLPPRSQWQLADLLPALHGSRDAVEPVEVVATGPVAVRSAIGSPSGAGRVRQGIPAMSADSIVRGTDPAAIVGVAEGSDVRTNFGVANLGEEAIDVTFEVIAFGGEPLGFVELAVQPGAIRQINRALLRLDQGSDLRASAVVRAKQASARYAAWASVVDGGTNDPTFRLATESIAGAQIIPAAAEIVGRGTWWHSTLDVFNPGSITASVRITALPAEGFSSQVGVAEFEVLPGRTAHFSTALPDLFSGDGVAALRIETTHGEVVAASRVWSAASGGTVGQGIAGVRPPERLEEDERIILTGLHETEEQRTNVGLVNLEGSPAAVTIRVVSPVGDERAHLQLELAPESLTMLNSLLSRVPAPTLGAGWVEIGAVDPPVQLLAWTSVVDDATSDATYHQGQVVSQQSEPD